MNQRVTAFWGTILLIWTIYRVTEVSSMPVQIRQLITHLNFKAAHSGTGTK
jgi:hypothetical protein